MRYLRIGNYLLALSPFLVLGGLVLIGWLPSLGFHNIPLETLLVGMLVVVCVEVSGLAFCLSGIRKGEKASRFQLGLAVFLIVWGIFVVLQAFYFYGLFLTDPRETYSITIWQATTAWFAAGFLWIASGIILLTPIAKLVKKSEMETQITRGS